MMRYIVPIILIAIAGTFFFLVTNPMYNSMSTVQAQISSYNNALSTSKTLEDERDALTTKYNAINPDDLARLQTLLPDDVNNIRLILEIEQIASPYGMTLTDIKYDTGNSASTTGTGTTVVQGGTTTAQPGQGYGTFNLEFSTSGTYENFINFTKDLESNLRIVDISSVSFSSDDTTNTSSSTKVSTPEVYTYDFKIKTYWLEN